MALNNAGHPIPKGPKTALGANGQYYFLRAADIYAYMEETYGPPTKHFIAGQGVTAEKFLQDISYDVGIYIMVTDPSISKYSGHATIKLHPWDEESGISSLGFLGGQAHSVYTAAKETGVWILK